MQDHLSTLPRLLGRAALAWSRHDASSMGAAIAFYALISLPPAVAVTLSVASTMFDPGAAREALLSQIQMLWGADAASTTTAIAHYAIKSRVGSWATWVAVVMSAVTASTVFVEIRRSLDVIWGGSDGGAVSSFMKGRLLAFAALVALGAALWISILVSTLLAAADSRYFDRLGISALALGIIGSAVTGIMIMALLAVLYKVLPQRHVAWAEAWGGASVVTCLYLVGKEAIAYYLGSATIAPAFGGGLTGALIVLLLWFYYSAQIFLYGAELSHEMSLERNAALHDGTSPIGTTSNR